MASASVRADGLPRHAFPFDYLICETPTFVGHTGFAHEAIRAFNHHDQDIAFDPLSTNRRFQPSPQLAGLATMVISGMSQYSIQVLIPDCTEPPVGGDVTVDLCHVVELFMGDPFDMGAEMPPTDLAEALCPNSLDPTLVLGQQDYWDEINPLLTKYRNVNKTRCPICARMIVVNMSRHLRLVHTTYCCYWRCPVPSCPSWFLTELIYKLYIDIEGS